MIPERSSGFRACSRTFYKNGYAPAHSMDSEMDISSPPPHDMSSTSSHQKSQPLMNQFTRGQSSMRPSTTPHSPSLTADQDVPGLSPRPSDAPPTSTHSSSSYPTPPLLVHGVASPAPQPSLPHAHPPHILHSSPPFIYHQHPGPPGASMSHMAYAPPSMTSMLRQHAPVYSAGAGTTSPLPVYPRHPVSPPPGTYSPLGYTTPPPFGYPSTSFAVAPHIYGSGYPHYTPSYGSPPEQENQAGWWYVPPGATPAAPSLPQHEDERSGQKRTVSPPYTFSSKETPFRNRFGDPSDPKTEANPSSPPSVSTSTHRARTNRTPPPSERRDWLKERRSYHPKTPAHRSEWVMWVGNVPSDATRDELQIFFNRPLPQSPSQSRESPDPPQVYGGVTSVFLIARSNCAFVNLESEAQLKAAVARFNGMPIRPDKAPCARLVCRVRRRTDDLKAGVGAQRGYGMHIKWIKEQRKTVKGEEADLVGLDNGIGGLPSPLTSDDDGQGRSSSPCSSISDSLASTDSGVLTRYFPQRYFILKSLTKSDLDLSVQRSVWATQQHNEEILDQAYRTSKDVFLIFSVNKSGEFYGYSRMAGRILHSKDRVPWASRRTSPVPLRSPTAHISPPASIVKGNNEGSRYVLSPEEYDQSSDSIPQPQEGDVTAQVSSAPAELHDPFRRLSHSTQNAGPSLRRTIKSLPFKLQADGPYRALRDQNIPQNSEAHSSIPSPSGESEDILSGDAALQVVAEEVAEDIDVSKEGNAEGWGRPFCVDWIRTDHLSFSRTKHLRNPWNHGREVKISRDGTELEPSIGRQLLEEWDKRPPSSADVPASGSSRAVF